MLLAATTYHFTEHLMHKTQRDRGFGSKLERVKGRGAIEMIQSREIISFRRVLFANGRLYSRFPLISLNPFSFVAFAQSPLLFCLTNWVGWHTHGLDRSEEEEARCIFDVFSPFPLRLLSTSTATERRPRGQRATVALGL